VIVWFWWTNHRFVATLDSLSPHFVAMSIVMLGFIVLLPFTTEALGTLQGHADEVATVVYAVNVALASLISIAMYFVALHDGLFRRTMSRDLVVTRVVDLIDTPTVFLLSVPIAIFWSPNAAHYFWLLLIPTGLLTARWARRRAAARGVPTPPSS
jgi:uncharacterized membrane protein